MDGSQDCIYVLFSATPYRMGRVIRLVTGEPYNHVSIAMEENLRELYAFARRHYHTPLYGGFVTEHPARYHHKDAAAQISLYRLPVSHAQKASLYRRLAQMGADPERYLYNHLSALAAPFHRKITLRDAFTCAEFTVSVLQELGLDFQTGKFYSIGDIAKKLEEHRFYEGVFPLPPDDADVFFAPYPVAHPLFATARDFLALFGRKTTI